MTTQGPRGAEPSLSSSFALLQRVRASFADLRNGQPPNARRERTLLRITAKLGATAVPLLARQLASAIDDHARWAYTLLSHLATDDAVRPRVVRAMNELATLPSAKDPSKLRALALLSELDADMPATEFADLGAVHERSLRQLAACLTSPADVAQAAELLLAELDSHDLIDFVDKLSATEPERCRLLVDEILVRSHLEDDVHVSLDRLRAALTVEHGAARMRRRTRRKTDVSIGRRKDGRQVLIASQRCPKTRPRRWRVMCCSLSDRGALTDAICEDDYTPGLVNSTIVAPLRTEGYAFEDISVAAAAALLTDAARATSDAGEALPRGYYLGRDMLGIFDEHRRSGERQRDELSALLGRSIDLMQRDDHQRARPLLERYVSRQPDDAAGRAALGVCCLIADDLSTADQHLERAAWLEPDNPLHFWNLASVAHRQGRLGGCYLSFLAYLERPDETADSAGRAQLASEFVAEYERLARLEYPDAQPSRVARADEQLYDARQLVRQNEVGQAIDELRKAVRAMPSHNKSWRYLASLHHERGELPAARRCADRALQLFRGDAESRELLRLVEEKLRQPRRARTAKPKTKPATHLRRR